MVHLNVKKGNASQDRIQAVLSEFGALVVPIPPDRDPFSRDLLVQVEEENLSFFVQSKTLSGVNPDPLKADHIVGWLTQREPTIPMWCSPDRDEVYWASLWHHLLRKGGLSAQTSMFSFQEDLRLLKRRDPASWAQLIHLVSNLARLWPLARSDIPRDYPPYLTDVVLQPDIFPYVLVCHRAARVITDVVRDVSPNTVQRMVLQVGPKVAKSPDEALAALTMELTQLSDDRKAQRALRDALHTWSEWISLANLTPPRRRLWALNRLLDIADPSAPLELQMEPYGSRYTWPLMSMVKLVPASFLLERLEGILRDSPRVNSRMYAAYLLSNLDHPDMGDLLLAVNNSLRRSEEFQKLGRAAVLVLRETEWGAAKQGNEAARRSILRGMEAGATWELHLPVNWQYYGAEPRRVLRCVTLHLEGVSKSDEFLRRPHQLLHRAMVGGIERGLLRPTQRDRFQG